MSEIPWHSRLAEHDRWLRTVVLARVGDPAAVDEVMQEVALAAVRQSSPLADAGRVAPWLYRVAIRQSLLYRRAQGRWRKLRTRYAHKRPPREHDHGACDPLEWLLADERQKLVRQAMARMPRRDVEILLLKYTANWSYEQLAQNLGTSESAIESRLHRARSRLRRELASYAATGVMP
jgi:RNA polymerase sigma-70 factor (ECF subfamily)